MHWTFLILQQISLKKCAKLHLSPPDGIILYFIETLVRQKKKPFGALFATDAGLFLVQLVEPSNIKL